MCNNLSCLNYVDYNFNYDEILENLKSAQTDDFVKIFSILNLDKIKTIQDAHIIIDHLTNHPTPIREALSFKLDELFDEKFFDEFIKNKLLDAIVDINPNVSRAVCALISKNNVLKENLEKDVISKIKKLILEIKNLKQENNNEKSHAKNKNLFSLYWLLEALCVCLSEKYGSDVLEILNSTIVFCDFTIREKTAKILAKLPNPPQNLLRIAKSDINFYVKNQVYDKIIFDD